MLRTQSFLYEEREGVGWITLNRPERLNALTFEVYRELTDTFAALRGESAVRCVVITGAGRAFCSGGDVHDIIGPLFERDAQGLLEFTRMTCELVRNIRALPKPVIASLNGTTARASRWLPTYASRARRPRSLFSSSASGFRAQTWARPISCRVSSGSPRRPSCSTRATS
jgi:hypothetical protein